MRISKFNRNKMMRRHIGFCRAMFYLFDGLLGFHLSPIHLIPPSLLASSAPVLPPRHPLPFPHRFSTNGSTPIYLNQLSHVTARAQTIAPPSTLLPIEICMTVEAHNFGICYRTRKTSICCIDEQEHGKFERQLYPRQHRGQHIIHILLLFPVCVCFYFLVFFFNELMKQFVIRHSVREIGSTSTCLVQWWMGALPMSAQTAAAAAPAADVAFLYKTP